MTQPTEFERSDEYQAEAKFHPERNIIAGIFANWGKKGPNSYPSALATAEILEQALHFLKVSRYQLNLLLGCPFPHYARRWARGEARPSSVYLARLLQLHQMKIGGLPIYLMRKIDLSLIHI